MPPAQPAHRPQRGCAELGRPVGAVLGSSSTVLALRPRATPRWPWPPLMEAEDLRRLGPGAGGRRVRCLANLEAIAEKAAGPPLRSDTATASSGVFHSGEARVGAGPGRNGRRAGNQAD